ncbi:hypothetical protein BN1318_180009 [Staphylococcus capitis]|nr:hypothetical protein BN1318_180009 [Staphylococcus capitis]
MDYFIHFENEVHNSGVHFHIKVMRQGNLMIKYVLTCAYYI